MYYRFEGVSISAELRETAKGDSEDVILNTYRSQ